MVIINGPEHYVRFIQMEEKKLLMILYQNYLVVGVILVVADQK
jgi:hypothetical protein